MSDTKNFNSIDNDKIDKNQFNNRVDVFFLSNGQECELVDIGIFGGKQKFLVRPYAFVELESMYAHCNGGYHQEVNCHGEAEVVGKEIVVDEIFKKPPTEKIAGEITALLVEKAKLLSEIADTKKSTKETYAEKERAEKELAKMKQEVVAFKDEYRKEQENLRELKESIGVAQGRLSEYIRRTGTSDSNEIAELKRKADKLNALENGGVDNWQWYDESIDRWNTENPERMV